MTMEKVVIFGAGKIAEEVYCYFNADSDFEVVAFTVDSDYITCQELFGLPVFPFEGITKKFSPNTFKMFVALGYQNLNQLRACKYREAKAKGYELVSYISSRASNMGEVIVGDNCLVLEHTTIQPLSKVGNNVFLWSGNHLGHHAEIKDHCYIAGHAIIGGNAIIGEACFLGVNVTVGHRVEVGDHSLVGAGALLTKNTTPKGVYIECETKRFRLDSEHFLKLTRM